MDGSKHKSKMNIDKSGKEDHKQLPIIMQDRSRRFHTLPWVEKYRPNTLEDVIDHREKIKVLEALISREEMLNFLFYGPPGTGKTSLILAVARKFYGKKYRDYMLELNASNERGIDTIRNIVQTFARTASDKVRLIFLDEADAMTPDAQNALKRVMEEHAYNCRFCLVCNDIDKIDPGIQSRCVQMIFPFLNQNDIFGRVKDIAVMEELHIEDNALHKIIKLLVDFRQILNKLQCLHNYKIGMTRGDTNYPTITTSDIHNFLCRATKKDIEEIYGFLKSKDIKFNKKRLKLLDIHLDNKWNLNEFLNDFIEYVIKREGDRMDNKANIELLRGLSEIHYHLHAGRDARIVLTHMATLFA